MQNDFGAEAGLLHRAGIDNPITKCAVRLTRKVIASARENERERESERAGERESGDLPEAGLQARSISCRPCGVAPQSAHTDWGSLAWKWSQARWNSASDHSLSRHSASSCALKA